MHHTKHIGNIAESRTKLALEEKGLIVFTTTAGHSPIDLVALDVVNNRTYKIQVKYRTNGLVPTFTAWTDKNGIHKREIDLAILDAFAMVQDDKICFVTPLAAGKTIRFSEPSSMTPYYWWEDFSLGQAELPPKRKICSSKLVRAGIEHPAARRVVRPSMQDLKKLLESESYSAVGRRYGVSDNAVRKWAKNYSLI